MLSDREQRILDELARAYADDGGTEPITRASAPRRMWMGDRPWVLVTAAVVGAASLFLIFTGAASGGLALATAGALGWLLRHYWPQLRDDGLTLLEADDDAAAGRNTPWRARVTRRFSVPPRSTD